MINEIKINDSFYPSSLKEINNAPKKLFYVGDINALNNNSCIAIVGTRKASKLGLHAAYNLGYNLAKRGYTIVSGLALGIDTYAHIGALMAGGKTIAVIGSGLKNIYPKENINLARKIALNKGMIITEYKEDVKPKPENFPKRNRIISGLSEKVIVVEAPLRSGSLITADCAIEQNKDLYCLIGDITNPNFLGCNLLAKEGAKPLTEISTFLL